jgi:hypothetical protein
MFEDWATGNTVKIIHENTTSLISNSSLTNNTLYNTSVAVSIVSTDIFSQFIQLCAMVIVLGAVITLTGTILYTMFYMIRNSCTGWR